MGWKKQGAPDDGVIEPEILLRLTAATETCAYEVKIFRSSRSIIHPTKGNLFDLSQNSCGIADQVLTKVDKYVIKIASQLFRTKHFNMKKSTKMKPVAEWISAYVKDRGKSRWNMRVLVSQQISFVIFAGKAHFRIRFGEETYAREQKLRECPECRASIGEFHCIGCEQEACPTCQALEGTWSSWCPFFCNHQTIDNVF